MLIACNNKNCMAVLSINKNFTVVLLSTDKLPIIKLDGVSTSITSFLKENNELMQGFLLILIQTKYFIS